MLSHFSVAMQISLIVIFQYQHQKLAVCRYSPENPATVRTTFNQGAKEHSNSITEHPPLLLLLPPSSSHSPLHHPILKANAKFPCRLGI